MEKVTEVLPFTEKPGTLYFAPLGSELPDMTVRRRWFVVDWSATWLEVGETNPKLCRAEKVVDRVSVGPMVYGVGLDDDTRRWTFDFAKLNMKPMPLSRLDGAHMMLGWESEDGRDRVIAAQVKNYNEPGYHHPDFALIFELKTSHDGQFFHVYLAGPQVRKV